MGSCYANPSFSQFSKVLTEIAIEGVVLGTPDRDTTGVNAYRRNLLDHMTMGRTQLPDGPIYVPEDSQWTMPAPESSGFLPIINDSLNPVPVSDIDRVVPK